MGSPIKSGMTDEKEFDRLFDVAELCNFIPEQYNSYQNSQKMIYDYENTIDFARKQGEAKGREEVAKKMKELGIDTNLITKSTGLSHGQIEEL